MQYNTMTIQQNTDNTHIAKITIAFERNTIAMQRLNHDEH